MSEQDKAFEKWYKNITQLLVHSAATYETSKQAWNAATAEANKRIEALEGEIEELKITVDRLQDCAKEYDDLIRHLDGGNDHMSFFAKFNIE